MFWGTMCVWSCGVKGVHSLDLTSVDASAENHPAAEAAPLLRKEGSFFGRGSAALHRGDAPRPAGR